MDEQQIRDLYAGLIAAWNRRSAKDMAALHGRPDAVLQLVDELIQVLRSSNL